MAILTSLFTGISGLNANGTSLSVIGNNIANVNTVGFKASRAAFSDVLSQSLTGSSGSQIGRGVYLSDVSTLFSQGSMETTSSALDFGIDGEGFFLVNDSAGTSYYSRAGQFSINKEGYIVNPEGYFLQAYQANSTGNATSTIGNIDVSSNTTPPNTTSNVQVTANLDSSKAPIASGFDINDVGNSYHFSNSLTVYDSLGNQHQVTTYYTKIHEDTAGGTGNYWQWNAVADGATGTEVMGRGYLQFDSSGALVAENTADMDIDPVSGLGLASVISDFNFKGGGVQNQAINFDFGTSITEGGSGLDGTTQFGSASTTVFMNQNGYAAGSLKSINVNQSGIISGLFTNGQTRTIGQIVIGMFTNPEGMTKIGKNLYAQSFDSGQPVLGSPDNGGRGRILANTLELSNVDLAEEFVKLITTQRAFQANSRIITTTDSMLEELVNLKR
ncbi:MAG: flagellar hook protein FlgE [Nitrospirae bacterium]|nr:flagellar hook protein FlgE [Nitrospirota bacterium]